MIHALDHVALSVEDLDAASASCATVLGRPPTRREASDSSLQASFELSNMTLVLAARAKVTNGHRMGLDALAFAVTDIDKAFRLCGRRGLPLSPPVPIRLVDTQTGAVRERIAATAELQATHSVALALVQSANSTPARLPANDPSAVSGLDHVVVRTPNPDRAIALYAGRLGLDLRLDRSNPAWGARLMFFRCGDLVVEIAHDLKAGVCGGPDELWGLSWRVGDVAAANERLRGAGLDVSGVRAGRRPGTSVFTVRNAGVPTLILGPG